VILRRVDVVSQFKPLDRVERGTWLAARVGCTNSTSLTRRADTHAASLRDDRGEWQSALSAARRSSSSTDRPAASDSGFDNHRDLDLPRGDERELVRLAGSAPGGDLRPAVRHRARRRARALETGCRNHGREAFWASI